MSEDLYEGRSKSVSGCCVLSGGLSRLYECVYECVCVCVC